MSSTDTAETTAPSPEQTQTSAENQASNTQTVSPEIQNPGTELETQSANEQTAVDGTHEDHEGHVHAPAFNPELTREVEVTIPAGEVSKIMRTTLKRYQRQARIPGFRAGKVPESLLRSRFAEGIRQEVLEAVLPQHFQKAIADGNYKLVSQPQVVDMTMEDDQPLWFKAAFEVLPEFSVDGYHDVKVERADSVFSDEDFASELERVRDSRSTMEPVTEERPLVDGDWAQITFTGELKAAEGEAAPEASGPVNAAGPIEGEDVLLEVGGKNTLEAFTAALRGASVGQQLKFEVDYPADFGEPRLAGKSVAYDVEVKGIKKRIQPELNDDFAKELGAYESYDDFLTKFRENLQNEKNRRTATETREKLMEALTTKFNFPVPESMVQQQIDLRLDRGLRALAAQGMQQADMQRLDMQRLRTAQHDPAASEVKSLLILDRIADAENVQVSDDELNKEIQVLSYQLREPADTLRSRLTADGSIARIREQLRRDKTGALLAERF